MKSQQIPESVLIQWNNSKRGFTDFLKDYANGQEIDDARTNTPSQSEIGSILNNLSGIGKGDFKHFSLSLKEASFEDVNLQAERPYFYVNMEVYHLINELCKGIEEYHGSNLGERIERDVIILRDLSGCDMERYVKLRLVIEQSSVMNLEQSMWYIDNLIDRLNPNKEYFNPPTRKPPTRQ